MTQPIPVTTDVADAIAQQVSGLTPDQAMAVLHALNNVQGGESVGTVKRDDATGHLAHRVLDNGVALWRVTATDGGQWNDLAATLAWTALYTPPVSGS